MTQALHLVLGGSGAVGQAVIKALQAQALPVKSLGRQPKPNHPDYIQADLLDVEQARQAIAQASHVYFCVGLPYTTKVWQTQWLALVTNVLKACQIANARLIFLDNIYLYSQPLKIPFDESQPQNPTTVKGQIRKAVSDTILTAFEQGQVKGVIGRCADFFGEGAVNSLLYVSILQRMLAHKSPQALSAMDVPHTYANVEDIGRALVALALDERTYGQVWHLPTNEPVTLAMVVEKFNAILGTRYQLTVMPRPLLHTLAWVMPSLKELKEMLYQFDQPYVMDSQKFRRHFPDFSVTPLDIGLQHMVNDFKQR